MELAIGFQISDTKNTVLKRKKRRVERDTLDCLRFKFFFFKLILAENSFTFKIGVFLPCRFISQEMHTIWNQIPG